MKLVPIVEEEREMPTRDTEETQIMPRQIYTEPIAKIPSGQLLLSPFEEHKLPSSDTLTCWLSLSPVERDFIVASLFGWQFHEGPSFPPYSQNMDRAFFLLVKVRSEPEQYTVFIETLTWCSCHRLCIDPGTKLTPAQLMMVLNPIDVAYAYVVAYTPGEIIPYNKPNK